MRNDFIKTFCEIRSSGTAVILVIIQDQLTDLCGNCLLQNHVINTFCEISPAVPSARHLEDRADKFQCPPLVGVQRTYIH